MNKRCILWIILINLFVMNSSFGHSDSKQLCIKNDQGSACRSAGLDYFYGLNGSQVSFDKAEELFEIGCHLNDGDSCAYLGWSLLNNKTPAPWNKIYQSLQKGVKLNSAKANSHLAWLLNIENSQKHDPKTQEKVILLFHKACTLNDFEACYTYASTLQQLPKNSNSAKKFFSKLCKENDAESCNKVAFLEYLSQNESKVFTYSKKACDLGSSAGCSIASRSLYRQNKDPTLYAMKACEANVEYCSEYTQLLDIQGDFKKTFEIDTHYCTLGNLTSCSNLAYSYSRGKAISKNLEKAEQIFQDICTKNNFFCAFLASFYRDNKINNSIKRLRQLDELACEAKNRLGCHNLGVSYLPDDPNKALPYLKKNCIEYNHAPSCTLILGTTQNKTKNMDDYLRYAKKACSLKVGDACNEVGVQIEQENASLSRAYLEKGCQIGSGISCFNLGIGYNVHGYQTPPNENINEAKKYFRLACDKKHPEGCVELAKRLLNEDSAQANSLLEYSCSNLNYGIACSMVAANYYYGWSGRKVDFIEAASWSKRACNLKLARDCELLAISAKNSKDVKLQKYFAQKACDLGGGCTTLGDALIKDGKIKDGLALIDKDCSKGKINSCTIYGQALLELPEPFLNPQKAVTYLEEASKNGDVSATLYLGLHYALGTKLPRNEKKVKEYAMQLERSKDNLVVIMASYLRLMLNHNNLQNMKEIRTALIKEIHTSCKNDVQIACDFFEKYHLK